MPSPSIIVYEKQPQWCPELQRQFLDEAVDVLGCSGPADFERRMRSESAAVGVIDVDAAPQDCLQLIARLGRDCVYAPIIAIGSTQTAALEWPIRELGALEFSRVRPQGAELARLCRRQWSAAGTLAGRRIDQGR